MFSHYKLFKYNLYYVNNTLIYKIYLSCFEKFKNYNDKNLEPLKLYIKCIAQHRLTCLRPGFQ